MSTNNRHIEATTNEIRGVLNQKKSYEIIFSEIEDDAQWAKILVDLAISVSQDLLFISTMRSPVTQSKFINLLDQDVFNIFMRDYCKTLPNDCINMLSQEKISAFLKYMPVSKLAAKIEYYGIIQKAVLLGFIDANKPLQEGKPTLLEEIIIYGKNCGSNLNRGEIDLYEETLETLLMHSDGNFSFNVFQNAHKVSIEFVALKYYSNRCKMLEAQIATADAQKH
jgi:hypothetical protein